MEFILKTYSLLLGSLLVFSLIFSGCGGGGGSSESPISTTKVGVFLDSAVEGVKYKTSSGLEGYTNGNGEYKFNPGDTVEFLVGDISLGEITATELISVLELTNSEEVAMLLQALDEDGNPENGINITPEAFSLFEDSSIDVKTVDPDDDTFLTKFKQISGDDFKVDRENALEHANYSLMLQNLRVVSDNLYAYYVGEANIYGNIDSMGKTVNAELLIEKSSRRLNLYNYNYVITPELDIMLTNAKNNIDSSFDSHENVEKFIATASLAVAETIAVIDTQPQDFTTHLKERSKEYALDQLLVVGKEVIDAKYPNVPVAIREALYREMTLVYGCADMFAKPSTADVLSCVNTLSAETLNIFNDGTTAWKLYNSTKALNTLSLVREYLDEYFNAGGNYNFIYNRYGVDNETDYVAALKNKTLVPSNVFWTEGDYLIDDELFEEKTTGFIGSVVAQSNSMVQNYGLKVDYDALSHSFLIPHITKGKYNVETNDFSICYTIENSSYFDISDLLINIKIDDETSTLVEKNTALNDMYKAVKLDEQCINIPLDSDFSGLDDKYFLATATLSFLAEGKSLTSTTTQAIYLSEANIFDLLKKLAPPNIVLNMATQTKDGDIFLVSASDSYVDPSQGELSFEWQQIESDGYNVTLQDADKAIPSITLPTLPSGTEQKTIWFEVRATASTSKQETTKTFSILVDASAEANIEVPQANAGMDVTIYIGENFTFEGTNTNTAYTDNFKTDDDIDWYWLNSDGEILSDKQSFTKTFDKNGTYSFKLEISDNNTYNQSLTTNDTILVTVINANTPPVANAGGNQNISTNTYVVLDGSGSYDADGDDLTYQWVLTDSAGGSVSLTNGTTSQANFRTDREGVYTISLTVRDGQDFSVASVIQVTSTHPVVIPNYPSVTLASVAPAKQGTEFSFEASLSESLDSQYGVKISLGDGGGGYLGSTPMTPNSTSDSFAYSATINSAGNRVYRVAIYEGETQVSSWVDGSYTVTSTSVETGTITHNGFTYEGVTSPYTGRVWLDRNLGASQVCTTLDDTSCYGGYYQWGRNTDGHQISASATSTAQATDITNVGNNFVIDNTDWTTEDDDGTLRSINWSTTDGSSVCPVGYRVPSTEEFENEIALAGTALTNNIDIFNSFLKLPSAGNRNAFSGSMNDQGSNGFIWSSSFAGEFSSNFGFNSSSVHTSANALSFGFSIRCIQDGEAQTTVPQNLTVTQQENNVLVSWDSVENAANYNVYFSQDGIDYQSATDNANGHDDTQTSFTFPYTNFSGYFKVKADDGEFSEIVYFTWATQASLTSNIKKTGQTNSYDINGTVIADGSIKDDGYYQSGKTANYTRASDMVVDEVTSLMWQDNAEASTITKTWFTQATEDECTKDIRSAACDDTSGDTAATYCSQLTLGGYTNWRLPTFRELDNLSDYSRNPSINSAFLNITSGGPYLSTTSFSYDKRSVWGISFSSTSTLLTTNKIYPRYIRCVRNQ